jgi:DNA primase
VRFDIEDYVNANLTNAKSVQAGNGQEMTAVCPACDRYGGFYVNIETGAYVCWKCDFRAHTVVGLVAEVEDISWSEARGFIFTRSVKLRRKQDVFSLADRVRAIRPHAIVEDEEPAPNVNVELPEYYVQIYDPDRATPWQFPRYLKERGITAAAAKSWGLGYCRKGKYGDRLIIPISCPAGESWTARAMSDDVFGPKYLNPPGADHRRLLIGWHVSRVTGDIVLCEGPLDAVRLYQHDLPALALGGKELHDEQLAMLRSLPPKAAVTIMLDPEEEVAPFKLAERLSLHFEQIYIAKLPLRTKAGKKLDPGESTRKQAHRAVDEAVLWRSSRGPKLSAMLRQSRKAWEKRW